MIKKTKLFSIFSFTILAPFNSLLISCGNKNSVSTTTSSNYSENEDNNLTISQDIKDFIINGVSPNEEQSIVVIKDLLINENTKAQKSESAKIETFLDQLASQLNKNNDEDKIELKDNKIIENGLKKIINENCKSTSSSLRTNFSSEFGEVAAEKILQINEDGLIFELKTFGIDKILRDIGYDQESEQEIKIANSQALKIYNFSTNLKVTVSKGGDKKGIVNINDLNLFVVSDREQAKLLKEGINDYLKKKFASNISLYLNGKESGGISNNDGGEINRHFTEIIDKNNYDLTNNDINKKQIMSYLSNIYLPKLIYKNPNQSTDSDQKATSLIKIDSKNLIIDPEKESFLKEGMDFTDDLKRELIFENFFGNDKQERQITASTVSKITPEHFLKDKKIYNQKYYSLGTGTLKVTQWTIRGFNISPIDIKFELLIHCDILKKHIGNLQSILNNVLDVMKKVSMKKEYVNKTKTDGEYLLKIYWKLGLDPSYDRKIKDELNRNSNSFLPYNKFLNLFFTEHAKEKCRDNFSEEILNNISFDFDVKYILEEVSNSNPRKYNYRHEIYFIFNSSFKIKLNNDLHYVIWNSVKPGLTSTLSLW